MNDRYGSRDSGRGGDRGGRDRGDDRGGRDTGRDRGGRDDRGGRGDPPSRERETSRASRSASGRGSGTGYVYRPRAAEDVKRRAESGGGDFDIYLSQDVKMFKAKDRDNTIRIVPPTWEDSEHYGLDIWVHYGIGPDRQTYLCAHKMKGEPCAICDERAEAARDRDDDYAKELEPKRRVLVYLIDRDDEKEGLQAWPMPQGTDQDIVRVSVEKSTGNVIPLDDPVDGYDVSFEKSGQGIKTRYEGIQIARRSSSLGDDRWLEQAMKFPLPDQLVYYSYDHIKSVFGGSGGGPRREEAPRDDSRGGRDSGRDERGSRGREPERAPEQLGWADIHAMNYDELCALVENERLDKVVPKESKDDDDLADWICDEMGIPKPTAPPAQPEGRGRVRVEEPSDARASVSERLAGLRNRR